MSSWKKKNNLLNYKCLMKLIIKKLKNIKWQKKIMIYFKKITKKWINILKIKVKNTRN